MKIHTIAGAMALVSTASAAIAGDKSVLQPVQVGEETVRFDRGVPTTDLQLPHGAVQITPLMMDHGGLSFGIAVLNNGDQPANIDVTNIEARAGAQVLPVLTRDQLEAKAKNRAMWASIAMAAIGGLSAAAAASQRDEYRSTLITPRGTYRAVYSAPSTAGQVQAAAIAAGTGITLANIQGQLDATRAELGANIVQITTVDPNESYAGRIVLTKIKNKAMPQRVDITVHWNGEDYPFAFQLAKKGTPMPIFKPIPARVSEPVEPTAAAATQPLAEKPISATTAPTAQ